MTTATVTATSATTTSATTTSTSTIISLVQDWSNVTAVQDASAKAAKGLMQKEQRLARELLASNLTAPVVVSSGGAAITVAVLKASEAAAVDIEVPSASISVPQKVLEQLGGRAAMTAGSLSPQVAQLLAAAAETAPRDGAAAAEGAERRFAAPPFSLSLFDEAGEPLKQLAEPIVLALHGEGNSSAVCVFWDAETLSWSTQGVQRVASGKEDQILCETMHLSIFAAMSGFQLDFTDCQKESFQFSLAFLGQNLLWWQEAPAMALWLGLVVLVFSAAVAANSDARSRHLRWLAEEAAHPDVELAVKQTPAKAERQVANVGLYCIRCLQAFRSGLDLDTLTLSLSLAQEQMDLEPTPLHRAALALAEQVDLCASATGAVCSFTGAGLGARVLLLFPALHPLRLLSTSLFYPKLSAVGFLGAKLVGPMALNVFTLQLFGRALSYRSQEICEFHQAILRPFLAALVSTLLGQLVVWGFYTLRRFSLEKNEDSEWQQVRRWRRRVRAFWVLLPAYLLLSVLLIAAFLSSVSQQDGSYWLYGVLVNVAFQLFLLPFLFAMLLAVLSLASRGPVKVSPVEEAPARPKSAAKRSTETPLPGSVLEDYFAARTSQSASPTRCGSLDLSPHFALETSASIEPEVRSRPDTPRCFEAALRLGQTEQILLAGSGTGALDGGAKSPRAQSEVAGWEELLNLDLDLGESPGPRPAAPVPRRRSELLEAEFRELLSDSPCATLGFSLSEDALGKTMTWSRKVEPMASIGEAETGEGNWPRAFHFRGDASNARMQSQRDTSDSWSDFQSRGVDFPMDAALDAFPEGAGQASDSLPLDAFPEPGVLDDSAWAWARQPEVPYETAASSTASSAFDETPTSAWQREESPPEGPFPEGRGAQDEWLIASEWDSEGNSLPATTSKDDVRWWRGWHPPEHKAFDRRRPWRP